MNASEFNELLRKARSNTYAIEPIYYEYFQKMLYVAEHVLYSYGRGNVYKSDAEDAVGNAFKSILQMARDADKPEDINVENPNAYMYKAVKSAAVKIGIERDKFVMVEDMERLRVDNESSDRIILKMEIRRFLKTLPEPQYDIAEMFYFAGFKQHEIAEQLHISENTIKWHVSEIKKKLLAYFANK